MTIVGFPGRCAAPAVRELVTPYCFGGLTEAERHLLEQHLLSCDDCWSEVRALANSVDVLRSDISLRTTVSPGEMVQAFGLAGRLNRRFAGHTGFVVCASLVYALLFAVPVLAELAYRFDQFGGLALRAAPIVGLWIWATSLLTLWLDARWVRSGATTFVRPLALLAASTGVLCLALLPVLPTAPTVAADFHTYPVRLGYLKSVLYAWSAGPLFVFWTFHFIVVLQREIALDRYAAVLQLLTGEALGLPPRGTIYVKVWALAVYLAGLFAFNYLGVAHLFDGLQPGPYADVFMALVLARVTLWLGLAVGCTWWYARCLTELAREAIALQTFTLSPTDRHAR